MALTAVTQVQYLTSAYGMVMWSQRYSGFLPHKDNMNIGANENDLYKME